MKKSKKVVLYLIILTAILVTIPLFATRMMVYAEGEEGEAQPTGLNASKLVIGTQNLVQAIIGWLTGISLTICGGYFIYYVYCLKTNDEGERRRNMQNIKTTLIAMIIITCGLALIDTILGFYK